MQKSSLLFEGKCHSYVSPETVQLVCGEVGRPVWLDETTIVFNAFAGKPPEKEIIGGSITSNRTFVTDVDRRLVQDLADSEYSTDRSRINTVAGPVFLPEGYMLPAQLLGVMLLAPDKKSVLRLYDDAWHLTGLYDGTDVELKEMWLGKGNGTVCYSYVEVVVYQPPHITWSPDGKSVACAAPHSEGTSMYLFYLSDQPSREVLWKDFHGYLVDWLP